jgi:hypothetical protein
VPLEKEFGQQPNSMRISCGLSSQCPHKLTFL